MEKTKLDKIISGIIFVVSIIWFIIQKITGLFTKIGLEEINQIIPFIAVFSVFCVVWSFVWDQKLDRLFSKIREHDENFTNANCKNQVELKELLIAGLSKTPFIESRILFEYEMHLEDFLSIKQSSGEYAQIYVITNDAKVESDSFGVPICKNIIKDHQYVYITPFEEKKFIKKLRKALFEAKNSNIDETLLEAAIQKNIRHIQSKELFEILPGYSDIVIYQKKIQDKYNMLNTTTRGFYSFQNGSASKEIDVYYYSEITSERASDVARYIDKLLVDNGKPDLSCGNYITKKTEIKLSQRCQCNGLFCVEKINNGEVILKKGGRFILKSSLEENLLKRTMYIQVNEEYVVSSSALNQNAGFPINHDCRKPNCGFASAIEIVATKDIEPGEEILIDYAYFDLDYEKFACNGCNKCNRKDCDKNAIEKEFANGDIIKVVSPYLRKLFTGGRT